MPTHIERLEAHASHLLDAFIQLRERYALLEPMLFDESMPKERCSGNQARGFCILKHSLFLSCSQDIANLTLDDDDKTPSLHNLIRAITDDVIRKELQNRFAIWKIPSIEEQTEPEIIEALHRIELREEAERREQFEKLYCEAMAIWAELSTSKKIKAFRIVRDKVSAHKEVRYVADKYQFVDIGTLGIKWGDLRSTIDRMKRLVELMGLLVRNAGFAWDMLDEQLSMASKGFWDISNAAEESIESGERKQ